LGPLLFQFSIGKKNRQQLLPLILLHAKAQCIFFINEPILDAIFLLLHPSSSHDQTIVGSAFSVTKNIPSSFGLIQQQNDKWE
jgi:hypothetical protein